MFFRSVTHATDSASTGWSAKIAAASHAPGTPSRRSSSQRSTALDACSRTLVTWNPKGSRPQR